MLSKLQKSLAESWDSSTGGTADKAPKLTPRGLRGTATAGGIPSCRMGLAEPSAPLLPIGGEGSKPLTVTSRVPFLDEGGGFRMLG